MLSVLLKDELLSVTVIQTKIIWRRLLPSNITSISILIPASSSQYHDPNRSPIQAYIFHQYLFHREAFFRLVSFVFHTLFPLSVVNNEPFLSHRNNLCMVYSRISSSINCIILDSTSSCFSLHCSTLDYSCFGSPLPQFS